MTPEEIDRACEIARQRGCVEALFCLGDRPERAWGSYRDQLAEWGHRDTAGYLETAGEIALRHGLLPHTNAGLLTAREMERLRRVNVSLGLMLETTADRLCDPHMPHHRAPSKRPDRRIATLADGGRQGIPFTSGILVGIGETMAERVDALLALRDLHRRHGHIQEVIVQNFRAGAETPMATAPEPDLDTLVHTIALARLVLDDDVSLQAPPNLSPDGIAPLISAGVNDLGGISPVTPDYVNPGHPWPHLDHLATQCEGAGFELTPRLPIYPRYVTTPGALHPELRGPVMRAAQRLGRGVGPPATTAVPGEAAP